MADPTEAILACLRQVGAGLDPDFLREAVRMMSALLMEIEINQQIEAGRYERPEERTTYRNGYRDREWQTQVGDVSLKIPKLREGSYPSSVRSGKSVHRQSRTRSQWDVNAYGLLNTITFPLLFSVYKPQSRLYPDDTFHTKPELAVEIVQQLLQQGFQFSLVLADSIYGESGPFISALEQLHLNYVVGLHFNHGVWLPRGARIRYTRWRPFARVFSNGEQTTRYICEVIYGKRQRIRYYYITVDSVKLPTDGI